MEKIYSIEMEDEYFVLEKLNSIENMAAADFSGEVLLFYLYIYFDI